MYLAQNIKMLREEEGMNQNELAEVLGVSQSAVANWEKNHRFPDIEMVVRLAKHFTVTLDDLILNEMKPPIPHYVLNIKFLRKKNNLTQEYMAKLLGVSNANYCKYENGAIDIEIKKLLKLADYFNVTLDELVKQDLKEGD